MNPTPTPSPEATARKSINDTHDETWSQRSDADVRQDVRPNRRHTAAKLGEEFLRDLRVLFKQQSRLLRQELKEKAKVVKTSSMSLTIGGALMLIALQTLTAALVFALAMVMPWWGSALLVGLVILAVGAIMVTAAIKRLDADHLTPKKSMDTFGKMNDKFQEKVHEYKRAH